MRPFIVSFLIAIPLFAQSRVTPKTPSDATTASTKSMPATFIAKCTTCANDIEGKLAVSNEGVDFCCTAFQHEGSRVTAKCPYSFHMSLADVKQQYLDSPDGGDHVWHVVNGSGEHYAFSSRDNAAADAAYEWVKSKSSRIVSSPLLEKYSADLAKMTHAPKIENAAPCK